MPFGLAAVLALDQRFEFQLPLILLLAGYALRRVPGTRLHAGRLAVVLALVALYLVANSAAGLMNDAGLAETWWAAPLRVGLFFVMLAALATALSSPRLGPETVFRTLEWLLLLKILVAIFEVSFILQTGQPRERPLFNIILSSDSLIGFRLTSSYDVLFAMLALSSRHMGRRLMMLAVVLVLTETRALLLLSVLFMGWHLYRERSPLALALGLAIPAASALLAVSALMADQSASTRLTQFEGSSLSDKQEQIEAVADLALSPYLLTGRGLGVSIPNIIRDEARPYSYEAQSIVLLWQGGLLFFAVYLTVLWVYGTHYRPFGMLLILGLGALNPTLFALASAFMLVALGKLSPAAETPQEHHDPLRDPAVHA